MRVQDQLQISLSTSTDIPVSDSVIGWTVSDTGSSYIDTGCPKKHGNSLTNSISSLLRISIAIPNFKSHNINKSARVYFIKRVKDCKDVTLMSTQDEQ